MNLYIDSEWNGFCGELISMALCSEDGKEFYESLGCDDPIPWVKKNVIPKIGKHPIEKKEFQDKLELFLAQFKKIHIIADWPEDLSKFCDMLIVGPGLRINTPDLSMEIRRIDAPSKVPHNALEDARSIRNMIIESA